MVLLFEFNITPLPSSLGLIVVYGILKSKWFSSAW